MSFLDSCIDIGAVIGAITHEHANRAIHLIVQCGNLRAVVVGPAGRCAKLSFLNLTSGKSSKSSPL